MLLLVVFSCLVSGIVLAEETGVNSTSSVSQLKVPEPPTNGRYYLYEFRLNWDQALIFCEYMKQTLATFDTQVDYDSLTLLISQNGGAVANHYWTAGVRNDADNKDYWHTTRKPFNYNHPCPGENRPSTTYGGTADRYIDLRDESGNYCLRHISNATPNFVICEKTPNT